MPSSTCAALLGPMCEPSPLIALFVFSETVVDQLTEAEHGLRRALARGFDIELGALRAAQEQHAHHALGVGRLARATDQDVARILRCQLYELGRRPGVQPELVSHLEGSTRAIHWSLLQLSWAVGLRDPDRHRDHS